MVRLRTSAPCAKEVSASKEIKIKRKVTEAVTAPFFIEQRLASTKSSHKTGANDHFLQVAFK
jgi:hypothetical protein